MSYWKNLTYAALGLAGRTTSFTSFGKNKYEANQQDKAFAFDEAYATVSDVYAVNNKIARAGN